MRASTRDDADTITRLRARVQHIRDHGVPMPDDEPATAQHHEETMTEQGQFEDWLGRGVDHQWNRETADDIKRAIERAKAVTAMVAQAKVQPEREDKLHAIERAAEMAATLSKALRALAEEVGDGD